MYLLPVVRRCDTKLLTNDLRSRIPQVFQLYHSTPVYRQMVEAMCKPLMHQILPIRSKDQPIRGPMFGHPMTVPIESIDQLIMILMYHGVPVTLPVMVRDLVLQDGEEPGPWAALPGKTIPALPCGDEGDLNQVLSDLRILDPSQCEP